jgi:hypothetical protein
MESGELQAYWASVRHPEMESGELLAPWASTLRREREREEPCRRCSCGCGLVIVFVFGAGSSSSSGGGGAEADNYFGGPGASDRLSSAQVEGAVVEGDEEVDRGPHVGDEDELRATGGAQLGVGWNLAVLGARFPRIHIQNLIELRKKTHRALAAYIRGRLIGVFFIIL